MASITFESFIKEQKIEIPAIQRDYVQGRGFTIEEQDKREAFVSRLINTIADDNAKPCHLEFIYGAKNNVSNRFIPLDGQQRLTTLFILHWVIWQKSSNDAQQKYPLNLIEGFNYETRLSSSTFCRNIIERQLQDENEDENKTKSLGQRLKNQPWFSEDWNYDPTIIAIISMVDFMEEKLNDYNEVQISSMLKKLCSDQNQISFDELNMTDYDLTDSLYIKMNARGKQLTPFENWKSDFIKYLEKAFGDEEYTKAEVGRNSQSNTYKDYFCYSIEHQWTDLFWTYLKDEYLKLDEEHQSKQYPCIDKMFMNLFDFLCMYFYYVKNPATKFEYSKIGAVAKREVWQNQEFIDALFGTLDSLCRIDHSKFFDDLFYICPEELPLNNDNKKVRLFRTKQTNLFKLCVENGSSMELTDLLLFYALIYYCNEKTVKTVDDSLKFYMRSVRNNFESDIQNIRTRTAIQLNLRVSEFDKYNSTIKTLTSKADNSVLSIENCIIDDCSITRGNNAVFDKAINEYGIHNVLNTLRIFCNESQILRIRLLVSCGYSGTYLSDCIGRNRYFWGSKDRWDVLFISDSRQLSECFADLTQKIIAAGEPNLIINEAKKVYTQGFAYYILNYDEFIDANGSQHHFAIKNNLNEIDWIALGSYSSNPGTAYHADPLAVAVENIVNRINPNIKMALYKQYSGKCPLSIVKDKIHWEPLFSVISRKDGWHIILGQCYITEDIKNDFKIQQINDQDYLVPISINRDMIQVCADLIIRVFIEILDYEVKGI